MLLVTLLEDLVERRENIICFSYYHILYENTYVAVKLDDIIEFNVFFMRENNIYIYIYLK